MRGASSRVHATAPTNGGMKIGISAICSNSDAAAMVVRPKVRRVRCRARSRAGGEKRDGDGIAERLPVDPIAKHAGEDRDRSDTAAVIECREAIEEQDAERDQHRYHDDQHRRNMRQLLHQRVPRTAHQAWSARR